MTLRNIARLGLGLLLLTGFVAGSLHAEATPPMASLLDTY